MKERLIKIIKRKDAEASAHAGMRTRCGPAPLSLKDTKTEDRLKLRKMNFTVSSWITELRANNRAERNAMLSKTLADRILLGPA
jgi:hypothetical protein